MRIWLWLKREENTRTLSFLGGGIAIIIGAFWTLFTYLDTKDIQAIDSKILQTKQSKITIPLGHSIDAVAGLSMFLKNCSVTDIPYRWQFSITNSDGWDEHYDRVGSDRYVDGGSCKEAGGWRFWYLPDEPCKIYLTHPGLGSSRKLHCQTEDLSKIRLLRRTSSILDVQLQCDGSSIPRTVEMEGDPRKIQEIQDLITSWQWPEFCSVMGEQNQNTGFFKDIKNPY